MSLNDFSIGSSGRGYSQLDEYGQPQRQSYGGSQLPTTSSINRYSQETYQQGSSRSTIELPPLNMTERITPSPYPTNNNPLPPFSSFPKIAAQPSYHSTQASSTTSLRSPANFNVPAAHSQSGTTSQSQHYPSSEEITCEASYTLSDTQRFQESGSRKAQLLAPSQRFTMNKRGNEGTGSMQHFPAVIQTSMQSSPPPSGRSERDIGISSSRQTKKERSRRRHRAEDRSTSHSSCPIVSMESQQSLQGYSESLQRYLTYVESPQVSEGYHEGAANLPPGYGTSGGQSSREQY